MYLSELNRGEKAVIVKVMGHGGFRKRIVEMGFVQGKVVEVKNIAPLRDPIEYRIMGYDVSLRKSEAEKIEIISIKDAEKIAKQNNFYGTITEEDIRRIAFDRRKIITIALVGNPNSGKTSLFNSATGEREKVGNYSGVTVGVKESEFEFNGYKIKLVDLPGTYSISAYSPEEKFVRNYLTKEKPDVVLNILDGTNLERNMFLTTQLIDMNLRVVIALNMADEMHERGDKLDVQMLQKLLGIPIVETSFGKKKMGMHSLFSTAIKIYEGSDFVDEDGQLVSSADKDVLVDEYLHNVDIEHKHSHSAKEEVNVVLRHIHINYGNILEKSIAKIKDQIDKNANARDEYTPRYIAIKLLEQDEEMCEFISVFPNKEDILEACEKSASRIKSELKDTPENAIMDAKYGFISGALKETFSPAKSQGRGTTTEKIDRIVTNRILGFPIFIFALFVMFQCTFSLGEYPMMWIEYGVNWFGNQIGEWMPNGILKDFLVDGMITGVGGVLVFLPNILILYFFITLLETTGYMARAAFIMDKIMHKIGLHGRSFIPLVMGFGCNVPAIMATRTIKNKNNRMVTILISPLISCSARLPIYLLLAGAFFPKNAGFVLFSIYVVGMLLAAFMARIFKRFLFQKEETPFVMELPPYRFPSWKYILIDTWEKGKQYLHKIGTTILVGSLIIWALSYFPRYNNDVLPQEVNEENIVAFQQENSYLGRIGKFVQPVLEPLGFNWKMSVSLLSGMAAKEVVVSTLGILYNVDEMSETSLSETLQASADFSPAVALSLMLFVLIYFPCIATLVTIKHETRNWWWALFSAVYTIVLAWIVAFVFYQMMKNNLMQEFVITLLLLLSVLFIVQRTISIFKKKDPCTYCNSTSCKGCEDNPEEQKRAFQRLKRKQKN